MPELDARIFGQTCSDGGASSRLSQTLSEARLPGTYWRLYILTGLYT